MNNYDVELYSDKQSSSDSENNTTENFINQQRKDKKYLEDNQTEKVPLKGKQKGTNIIEKLIDTNLNNDFTQ